MSLKILSTLAVVATVAEATNSLRSTSNAQPRMPNHPRWCGNEGALEPQWTVGGPGCFAKNPSNRVCGNHACGSPNQMMSGMFECLSAYEGMACHRAVPVQTYADDNDSDDADDPDDMPDIDMHYDDPLPDPEDVHEPPHTHPCGVDRTGAPLAIVGHVVRGTGQSVEYKRVMCATIDGYAPKAHCRCVSRAYVEHNRKGLSICNSGCGASTTICDRRFGCHGSDRQCNSGYLQPVMNDDHSMTGEERFVGCTCKPRISNGPGINDMTIRQCRTECARVGMMIPTTNAHVREAANTGCDPNTLDIWVQ